MGLPSARSLERLSSVVLFAILMAGCGQPGGDAAGPAAASGSAADGNADRKDASAATKTANGEILNQLPFNDRQSFEDANRGFIVALPDDVILGPDDLPIWDPQQYSFIEKDAAAPETVNPSLWRQSQLINISGLFEVMDGVYQVRNQDLSNMTIIEGEKGITVVDPLISAETARVAIDLYFRHRGKKNVKAVIYTHSHVDHYGGVRGVVDEELVRTGLVKIYAPEGFLENAVAENVMAGNAMSRRASYMYGNLLPADPKGQVGAGLGTTTSAGTITLIAPTDIISRTGQTEVIDGLTYEFLNAPGTEAPSEMLWLIKEKKLIEASEDAAHTLHNTYSLRGAKIRDPLAWSKALNAAIDMWGDEAEVLINQHHWPVWGQDRVVDHLKLQRDLYRYVNDETLRLANQGYTMIEIAEQISLPAKLARYWSNRGYYGALNHNVKATYVLYLGWFDGNPATLHVYPPEASSKKYVEFMGGADAVLARARAAFDDGDYRWVAEVVNHVVFADPRNEAARFLQADALEQMGYQAESGPWRNFYLTGAQELRKGVAQIPAPSTASPDTIRAMSLDLFWDFLAMRLNGPKAAGRTITLNFEFPDEEEKYLIEMTNGVLNHTKGRQAPKPDATITVKRATLNDIVLKTTSVQREIEMGEVEIDGDKAKLDELLSYLDSFEFWFNIVTP